MVRKESKSGNPPANPKADAGADKTKADSAVMQSLIDVLRYPNLKTCHRCHGRGVNYANSACETCKGTGKEIVNIPGSK